jgi:hypothetical protein
MYTSKSRQAVIIVGYLEAFLDGSFQHTFFMFKIKLNTSEKFIPDKLG